MMDSIKDLKDIKKLADACRKAGIKSFKGFGIEFTLSEVSPQPLRRRRRTTEKPTSSAASTPFTEETVMPSPEELLFWSSEENPLVSAISDEVA